MGENGAGSGWNVRRGLVLGTSESGEETINLEDKMTETVSYV